MTEAEAMAGRAGFELGAEWAAHMLDAVRIDRRRVSEEFRRLFPLPQSEQPRIATDADGDEWRWTPENGLEFRYYGDVERNAPFAPVTPESLTAWLFRPNVARCVGELLVNPTSLQPHPQDVDD